MQPQSLGSPSVVSTIGLAGLSIAVLGVAAFAEQAGLLWPASPVYFMCALAWTVSVSMRLLARFRGTHHRLFLNLSAALVGVVFLAILWFYNTHAGARPIYLLTAGIVSIPVFLLVHERRGTAALLIYVLVLCAIVMPWKVPWNRPHQFLRDLDRIRIGMPLPQVDEIMAGHLKGVNQAVRPWGDTNLERLKEVVRAEGEIEYGGTIVYRHSDNSADWGIVEFRNSRVVEVRFSRD